MLKVMILLCSVCIFIYTFSYGLWEWRHSNRIGSVFVYFLALLEMGLSLYAVIIS